MAEIKALMTRFYQEVLNEGRLQAIDELCAPEIVNHEAPPEFPRGLEGVRAWVNMFRAGAPDLHVTVEDVIAEGDRGVARVVFRGTHKGDLYGIPPTGKEFTIESIDIVRVERDKAVEHWGLTDVASMMEQLGVLPATQAAKT